MTVEALDVPVQTDDVAAQRGDLLIEVRNGRGDLRDLVVHTLGLAFELSAKQPCGSVGGGDRVQDDRHVPIEPSIRHLQLPTQRLEFRVEAGSADTPCSMSNPSDTLCPSGAKENVFDP